MSNKGMRAVSKIKKQMDANRESAMASLTPAFQLQDGKSAVIWFNGNSDNEPFITYEHSMNVNGKFSTMTCAKGTPGHDGCVACYQVSQKDRRVNRPSPKAVFNVVDTRWVHKVKDEQRSAEGRERFSWTICSDDMTCKLCKRKAPREHGGQKRWTVSLTWAQALDAINDDLKRKCLNCGGKTKLTGFVHTETGETVDEVPEGDEELYEASYDCTKCDNCVPRTIFDVPIKVIRSGSQKDTSYQFSKAEDEEKEDWIAECKPIDLESACKPRTADWMAERLGVTNPFGGFTKGKETEEYDSEGGEGSNLFED